jgi:hypothetical protein
VIEDQPVVVWQSAVNKQLQTMITSALTLHSQVWASLLGFWEDVQTNEPSNVELFLVT